MTVDSVEPMNSSQSRIINSPIVQENNYFSQRITPTDTPGTRQKVLSIAYNDGSNEIEFYYKTSGAGLTRADFVALVFLFSPKTHPVSSRPRPKTFIPLL